MGSLDAYYERFYDGPPFKTGEEMQYEVLRLASFVKWPVWAVKRPGNLSENGFYYCGHNDTVKCYECDVVIGNWSIEDDVETEHKKRSPNCPFILGRANNLKFGAGNVIVEKKGITASSSKDVFGSGAPQLKSLEDIKNSGFAIAEQDATKLQKSDTLSRLLSFKEASGSALEQLHSLPSVTLQDHDGSDGAQRVPSPEVPPMSSVPLEEVDLNLTKYEKYRLLTFEGRWPENSLLSPVDLARAGFYYTGTGDTVQCPFCKGRLLNWKPSDIPLSEHHRHYPNCPFLKPGNDVGNVTAESEEKSKVQMPQSQNEEKKKAPSPSDKLGIMMEKPKHAEYAIERSRLETFKTWPKRSVIMPADLAKAGFFYVGYSDNVKCFFCDGGLRNWTHADDPWREHARWFSKCGFLRLNKSEEYIEDILAQPNTNGGIETHNLPSSHTGPKESITPRELRARMDTPIVRHVMTMGFSNSLVQKVIEDRLRLTGDDFSNAEELLQALFNENDDNLEEQGAAAEAVEVVKPTMSRRKKRNRNRKKRKGLLHSKTDESMEATPPLDQETGMEEEELNSEDSDPNELNDPLLDPMLTTDEEYRSLIQQYKCIKEERTCKICMDADCSVVFLPCGHLVCCSSCAPALRTCPICRTFIKGSVRIFTT